MKGLYIEDEISLAQTVIESLEDKGVKVKWVRSVKEAVASIMSQTFSFYIIDIGLTDGEGFEVAQVLKDRKEKSPILFLTARSSAEDRLKGYELGATEFIPKPFLFAELWLRLSHVLEEHAGLAKIQLDGLTIDTESFLLKWSDGEIVELGQKEMEVLKFIHSLKPKAVRRSEILDEVWGEDRYPSERSVDNIVSALRTELKQYGKCIKSIRGVGYAWREEN